MYMMFFVMVVIRMTDWFDLRLFFIWLQISDLDLWRDNYLDKKNYWKKRDDLWARLSMRKPIYFLLLVGQYWHFFCMHEKALSIDSTLTLCRCLFEEWIDLSYVSIFSL